MAKKIQPAPGYVLIEPAEAEKQTASGIVLPESHDEKPQKGKVLAVGDPESCECGNKCERKAPCKEGDTVIYKKWGGNEYKTPDGKELLFIKFEDIMAVEA